MNSPGVHPCEDFEVMSTQLSSILQAATQQEFQYPHPSRERSRWRQSVVDQLADLLSMERFQYCAPLGLRLPRRSEREYQKANYRCDLVGACCEVLGLLRWEWVEDVSIPEFLRAPVRDALERECPRVEAFDDRVADSEQWQAAWAQLEGRISAWRRTQTDEDETIEALSNEDRLFALLADFEVEEDAVPNDRIDDEDATDFPLVAARDQHVILSTLMLVADCEPDDLNDLNLGQIMNFLRGGKGIPAFTGKSMLEIMNDERCPQWLHYPEMEGLTRAALREWMGWYQREQAMALRHRTLNHRLDALSRLDQQAKRRFPVKRFDARFSQIQWHCMRLLGLSVQEFSGDKTIPSLLRRGLDQS